MAARAGQRRGTVGGRDRSKPSELRRMRESVGWQEYSTGGSFGANGYGLHDMHGNVWEWVEDCWHGNYEWASSDGRAWMTGGDCDRRVLRGGSWNLEPRYLRSADRSVTHRRLPRQQLRIPSGQTLTP